MGQALRKQEKSRSREKTRLDGLQTRSPIGPTSADKYVCGRRAAGVPVNASKVISVVCVCVCAGVGVFERRGRAACCCFISMTVFYAREEGRKAICRILNDERDEER